MGNVIMFANQKGGVGKTSSCIEVGYILSARNNKVLLIDLDAQCNLSSALDILSRTEKNQNISDFVMGNTKFSDVYISYTDNLDIIPGSRKMLSQYFTGASDIRKLKKAIEEESLKEKYDYILVDVGPEGGNVMTMAFLASDFCIAVATPASLAYSGVVQMISDIRDGRENYVGFNVRPLGILINAGKKTKVDTLNREKYTELAQYFAPLFKTEIRNSVIMNECKELFVPLSVYRPGNILVQEYEDVVDEIEERIHG